MKLDKFWKHDRDMYCPFCRKKGLWYDTHEEQDATHVCKKCKEIMTIVASCDSRGIEE